jgi:hypothetical protein
MGQNIALASRLCDINIRLVQNEPTPEADDFMDADHDSDPLA